MEAAFEPAFRLVKSEIVPLTLDKCIEFRDMKPSPTERELKQPRVDYLYKQFVQGRAKRFDWAYAVLDGEKLRMNGQHSSHALCRLDGAFPEGLVACIDEYHVASMEGLVDLFRQFDPPQSTRNAEDVSGAFQGIYTDLSDVNRKVAKLGAEAISWYRTNVLSYPPLYGNDRYSLFREEQLYPFLTWLDELFTKKVPELQRPNVVAAMYGTFDKNEEAAREFWQAVAWTNPSSDTDLQSTVLDNWLMSLIGREEERPDVKAEQVYQGCVFAWNASRTDKTITDIRYRNAKLPAIKE
jgi:hypothetical protein